MTISFIIFLLLLLTVPAIAVRSGKLTIAAGIVAFLVGIVIYLGTGLTGIVLIGCFFLMGVLATSWKAGAKEKLGFAEQNKGLRTAAQVLANGGLAAILALLAWLFPYYQSLLLLMLACSLSSAAADTISSELGMLYGSKFYNIISFKKDTRGENGVISLEGTLLGVAASMLIAIIYAAFVQHISHTIIIILAGTIGNFTDSIVGATLERDHRVNNNTVNFINTLVAALAGLVLWLIV